VINVHHLTAILFATSAYLSFFYLFKLMCNGYDIITTCKQLSKLKTRFSSTTLAKCKHTHVIVLTFDPKQTNKQTNNEALGRRHFWPLYAIAIKVTGILNKSF